MGFSKLFLIFYCIILLFILIFSVSAFVDGYFHKVYVSYSSCGENVTVTKMTKQQWDKQYSISITGLESGGFDDMR